MNSDILFDGGPTCFVLSLQIGNCYMAATAQEVPEDLSPFVGTHSVAPSANTGLALKGQEKVDI